jgi:hypothetical protein
MSKTNNNNNKKDKSIANNGTYSSNSNTSTPIKKQSFSERFNEFKANTPSTNGRETKVSITKILDEDNNMIGFTVYNFYGARDYFLHEISSAFLLAYKDRLDSYVKSGKISSMNDIQYIAKDNTNPTVLVSSYPPVENTNAKETINTTLETFITYFTENNDPVNNCKVKFCFEEDYQIKSEDEINSFFFLATLINLPERLKANN